jgi:sugar lactone lactonase YvrE
MEKAMKLSVRLVEIVALFAFGAALSGCGGGNNALPYQSTQNTTSSSTETVTVLAAGSESILVALGGYSGTITFPPSNAPSGTQATLTSIAGMPSGGPTPSSIRRIKSAPQNVLFSVELTLTQTVTFSALPSFTLSLPSSISTSGESFYIAAYNGTSASSPQIATLGPASVNGQMLTFTAPNNSTTLNAGATYLFELYETSTGAPQAGTIYVINAGSQVEAFAAGSGSGATAINSFASTSLVHPTGMAVDATGRVYVAQSPNIYSYTYASYNGQTSATPSTTLTSVAGPWGLVIDTSGNLVATDSTNNAVDFFGVGANGATSPFKSISGSNSQLSTPYQAAFDGSGNLYVVNAGSSSITVYSAASIAGSGTLNVAPTAVITSSPSAIDHPVALAVDSTGRIYVGNSQNTTISVFTYANGYQAPLATLTGGSGGSQQFGCICEATLAVDASNNFYVAGETDPDVLIFNPVTSSSATPATTITSSSFTNVQTISVVP